MTWIVRLLSLSRSESHHHLQSKAAAIQIQMSRYPDIQIQMSVCDSLLLVQLRRLQGLSIKITNSFGRKLVSHTKAFMATSIRL